MIWLLGGVLVLGLGLLFLMRRGGTPPTRSVDTALIQRRWSEVEAGIKQTGSARKQAVIEADKLLDYVLRQQNYPGETMAERLKRAEKKLSDPQAVWSAHKLRNRLVHEPEADLIGEMGKRDVAVIKEAISDLGVKL